jgi:hypothetical protein
MENEKEMTKVAFIMAETIITGSIIMNKGKVHKNLPYVQNVSKKEFDVVCKTLGNNIVTKDVDVFNDILCNVLEKRLDYYYAEGFTEERDDHFYFFTNDELNDKNEELYGQD